MSLTGCTSPFYPVIPEDNPNEGRVRINNTFDCIVNTLATLTGPSGSTFYTNSTPTTATLGGIPAGSTFLLQSMQQMFDALLYPYQSPTFSSFLISSQTTTLEVGDTVAGGSRTFTWGTTSSSNVSGSSISINDNTASTNLANTLANDGTESIVIGGVTNTASTSHVWGIVGYNTNNVSFSSTFTVNWRYRIYYGTNASTTLTAGQITGLTSSALATTFSGTFSFASGDYKYFIYPDSFGSPTSTTGFKDTSTSLPIAMATVASDPFYSNLQNGWYYGLISVTNVFGVVTSCRVYRSFNVLGSSINIQIS